MRSHHPTWSVTSKHTFSKFCSFRPSSPKSESDVRSQSFYQSRRPLALQVRSSGIPWFQLQVTKCSNLPRLQIRQMHLKQNTKGQKVKNFSTKLHLLALWSSPSAESSCELFVFLALLVRAQPRLEGSLIPQDYLSDASEHKTGTSNLNQVL